MINEGYSWTDDGLEEYLTDCDGCGEVYRLLDLTPDAYTGDILCDNCNNEG